MDKICCYCGTEFDRYKFSKQRTKEHLVPLSRGGSKRPNNIKHACLFCNNQKGKMFLQEYLELLKEDRASSINQLHINHLKIENIQRLINYVEEQGEKMFHSYAYYTWYKRRYLKENKINA